MPKPRESLGPAVHPVTRELRYTSVSALSKGNPDEYGGCLRRWYFRYVQRLPEPQTTSQARGERADEQLNFYLSTGQDVLGPNLRVGRHLLPAPGPDLVVQAPLGAVRADGVPLIGNIDWVNPRGTYVSPEGTLLDDPPDTMEAGDNKTTSDLVYAKTEEQVANSTQMIGYAEELSIRMPNLKYVRLSHVTFQFGKSKDAVKRTVLIPIATVKKRWEEKGHQVIKRLRGIAKVESYKDVPMNDKACNSFNKACPHIHNCFKTPIERLKAVHAKAEKGSHVSLLSKVKATGGGSESNGALPPARPGFQVKDESTTPDRPKVPGLIAAHAIQGQSYRLPDGTTGIYLTMASGKFSFLPITGGAPVLLDPQSTIVLTTLEAAPAPTPPAPVPAVALPPLPAAAVAPAPPASVPSAPLPLPPAPALATPWPAGPPLPPLAPALPAPAPAAAAPATAAVPSAALTETPAEVKSKGRRVKKDKESDSNSTVEGIHLYVNAIPGGPFTSLDYYIRAAVRQVEEKLQVSDIRCAPNDESPLAFGKWKGVLASMVRAQPPMDGIYVAFTRGNELADVVVEALAPLCDNGLNVTRGI